jgi:3-deoxy-7-phosphoheptulonate synthase
VIALVRAGVPREEIERLRAMLLGSGCEVREAESAGYRLLFAERHWELPPLDLISQLKASEWVERVVHSGSPIPIIASDGTSTAVRVADAVFGGREPVLIAGPCTVETPELLIETAEAVKDAGAKLLRGGAFKPTTSPYSFAGNGFDALKALSDVRAETGLGIVTEVLGVRLVEKVAEVADMVQIGARSMQNFELLKEVGRQPKPVLLKRAMGATVEEWLSSAEYIAKEGNESIVLCERGIRTFEGSTRATLDVAAIPVAKSLCRLPVIADPSHAAGNRALVPPLALAALGAGADGLIIEVHPRPEQAVKDGAQTISTDTFRQLAARVLSLSAAHSEP